MYIKQQLACAYIINLEMNMKRIFLLSLVVFTFFILCSCDVITPISTDNIETTSGQENIETINDETKVDDNQNTQLSTTSKSGDIVEQEEHYVCSFYGKTIRKVETETRIFYFNSVFTYRNKLDDESYFLCFDPLCDHTGDTCTYNMFRNCSAIYSKLDNRIYSLYKMFFVYPVTLIYLYQKKKTHVQVLYHSH